MTTLDEKIASLSPERRRRVEELAEELIAEERAAQAAREGDRPNPPLQQRGTE